MSCTTTAATTAADKIEILLGIEAMNRYRKDHYGMTTCKDGYDYMYLADLKFLLQMTSCAQDVCQCYCDCSYTQIVERINTL